MALAGGSRWAGPLSWPPSRRRWPPGAGSAPGSSLRGPARVLGANPSALGRLDGSSAAIMQFLARWESSRESGPRSPAVFLLARGHVCRRAGKNCKMPVPLRLRMRRRPLRQRILGAGCWDLGTATRFRGDTRQCTPVTARAIWPLVGRESGHQVTKLHGLRREAARQATAATRGQQRTGPQARPNRAGRRLAWP